MSGRSVYNYYRDYDPQTGRYVESDPVGLIAGVNTYGYVLGNPLSLLDPLGLLVEVITFTPVGHGKSSAGHSAININGTTYSFGEKGWYVGPTDEYLRKNSFRDAIGEELNLTPEEERRVLERIKDDVANNRSPYSLPTNTCVTKLRDLLEAGSGRQFRITGDAPLSPVDFRDNLIRFGYVKKFRSYLRSP